MRFRHPTRSEAVIFLTASVLSLALAELAVATLLPQPTWRSVRANTPAMFIPSDTFPYRLRPGYSGRFKRPEFDVHVRIDSAGFRSQEPNRTARAEPLIVSMGDSFTFGWGVNDHEAYPARLGEMLRLQPGYQGVRTLNAGFASGYAPDTYVLFSRLYAAALAPDLVTVGVFIGNDIDGYPENQWLRRDSNGLPLAIVNTESRVDEQGYFVARQTPLGYRIPILRNSHLFHMLGTAFRHVTRPTPRRGFAPLYRMKYDDGIQADLVRSGRLLLAVDSVVASTGSKCVFVLIPTLEQVLAPSLIAAPDLDYGHPQRELTRLLLDGGADVLDLLPLMRGSSDRDRFYLARDQHWTQAGHEFAASAIADWLTGGGSDVKPLAR